MLDIGLGLNCFCSLFGPSVLVGLRFGVGGFVHIATRHGRVKEQSKSRLS